jgi:hypothetical protein
MNLMFLLEGISSKSFLPIDEFMGTTANEEHAGHTLSFEMCRHDE